MTAVSDRVVTGWRLIDGRWIYTDADGKQWTGRSGLGEPFGPAK